MNNIITHVYDTARAELAASFAITPSNWLQIAVLCMQIVEQIPHLSGTDKRAVVSAAVIKLVEDSELSASDKASLNVSVVPHLCDIIIAAHKGLIFFEEHKEEISACCVGLKRRKNE